MGTIMDKIRFLKAQRMFDKALALVNDVLDQDPNIPEALYLKAHVLWEGFKNPWGAECCFRRVLEHAVFLRGHMRRPSPSPAPCLCGVRRSLSRDRWRAERR